MPTKNINMCIKNILLYTLIVVLSSCGSDKTKINDHQLKIEWVENLPGDFSFINKWSYHEGIYKNDYGELDCDGLCPPEIDAMRDTRGRIYGDSLKAFYKYIDTTHLLHTIACEAWCYEWSGTDFIEVQQISKDTVECYTSCNASTHSSLHFYIVKDSCYPTIELTSLTLNGKKSYYYKDGFIKIDKNLFAKGIMKADFKLNFDHPENPKQKMYWNGRIYTSIKFKV